MFAVADPAGGFYCSRCFRQGFTSIDAVRGHRRSESCKAGLGGVQATVDEIRDRNSSRMSGSLPAAHPAAQRLAEPLRASHARPMWAPARPVVRASQVVGSDGASAGRCPGCVAMAERIAQLEEDVQQLAVAGSNHLGHAQAMLAQAQAQTGPSTLTIVVGLAAVGLLGAWALGVFDRTSSSDVSMGDSGSRSSSVSGIASVLDVVGKGARAYKSLKGLF